MNTDSQRWAQINSKLMLRDGKSSKAFDSFFVLVGTVEISAAFQRRVAEVFLPRPVRTLDSYAGGTSGVPTGRRFICRLSRQ